MVDQHPPVGVFMGGFSVFESLQKAPFGGSRDLKRGLVHGIHFETRKVASCGPADESARKVPKHTVSIKRKDVPND